MQIILESIADHCRSLSSCVDASIEYNCNFPVARYDKIPDDLPRTHILPPPSGVHQTIDSVTVDKVIVYRTLDDSRIKGIKIWAGDIILDDKNNIYLSISTTLSSNPPWAYKNTILDPASLDELFVLLIKNIEDVGASLPSDLSGKPYVLPVVVTRKDFEDVLEK